MSDAEQGPYPLPLLPADTSSSPETDYTINDGLAAAVERDLGDNTLPVVAGVETAAQLAEADQPKASFVQRFRNFGASALGRSCNVAASAVTDYQESTNKPRLVGTGVGVLALQALDRARASVVIVPTLAVDVLERTHSPTQAALAGGLAFGAWCTAVGGTTTEGLAQFPGTVEEFEHSFPGIVNFVGDGLPGFEQLTAEQKQEMSLAHRVGTRLLTGLKRGGTVVGIGSVAYVSTAAVKGRSRKDTHMLNLNASADGGVAVGAVIYGVGEAIIKIGDSNPELAMHIQDVASDIRLWYGIAVGLFALQYASNYINKHKAASLARKNAAKHRAPEA